MSAKSTTNCGRIADIDWIRALYELGQKAANGAHPQQVNERGAVEQLLHPLERDLAAIRAHGISTALPKTSRSISSWNGILISESGLSQCTTGLTRPSATRRSSSR